MPRLIGEARAKEMILTGARWDAAKALQYGLVSEVVPAADLLPAARRMAERILALGPLAVRLCKAALNASSQMPLAAGLSGRYPDRVSAFVSTRCCIAGGGPAGMISASLGRSSRAYVRVKNRAIRRPAAVA